MRDKSATELFLWPMFIGSFLAWMWFVMPGKLERHYANQERIASSIEKIANEPQFRASPPPSQAEQEGSTRK